MTSIKTGKNDAVDEYQVAKIEKIAAPKGVDGDDWYTYVIEGNKDRDIIGSRRGTLQQVKQYAQEYTDDINLRLSNGGYSMWTTRKMKLLAK